MKIYLAGVGTVCYELAKKAEIEHILESYFYIRKKKDLAKNLHINHDFFLDSGAFSALTQNKPINIKEYIEFIQEIQPSIYAGLDVIGDPEKTKENMIIMEKEGLSPIPTFHRGSDFIYLSEMIEKYPYIALGGMAGLGVSKTQILLWLDRVFTLIQKKKPDLKVHGFACSGIDIMKCYPWYSVDSSSWCACVKFDRDIGGFTTEEILRNTENYKELERGERWDILVLESLKYFKNLSKEIDDNHFGKEFTRLNQLSMFD